jgi:hypothetical protein
MADTDTQDQPLERMSVAPEVPKGDAGQDRSIEKRLEKHPESKEARLDRGLDESMDASDPPASTQPVHQHHPPASSGYDEEAERKLAEQK